MYARSTTVRGRPEAIDRGIAEVRDQVFPAIKDMEGCAGLSMLVDRSSGECIVTTSWESEDAMRASEERVRSLRENAATTLEGTATVTHWEMAVMHRGRATGAGSCVRSTWLHADPSVMDRAIDYYRTALIPRIEQLDGFCSASLMVDRSSGSAVSSVAFADRGAMERTREHGQAMRDDSGRQVGTQVLEVREYELVLAHLHAPEMV